MATVAKKETVEAVALSFTERIQDIQSNLKAPKGQFNSFGKYAYRNQEDILEAVKPLLERHKLRMHISDSIVEIGGRIYVEATVIVTNGIESQETKALAREEESKKGMDSAQLTGSTSSYARKYALNGMFLIDDTKDSDATNMHGKELVTPSAKAEKTPIVDMTKLQELLKTNKENTLKQLATSKYLTKEQVKNLGLKEEDLIGVEVR